MLKISQGRVRDRNITWFPELVDKSMIIPVSVRIICGVIFPLGKSIKTHLYWAMKNCGGNADSLRSLIDNIPSHYQVCLNLCIIVYVWYLHVYICVLMNCAFVTPGRPFQLPQHLNLPPTPLHTQQRRVEGPTGDSAALQDSARNIHIP